MKTMKRAAGLLGLVLSGIVAAGAEPAAPAAVQQAYGELAGKTGDGYLAARDQLLAMDKATVREVLEAKAHDLDGQPIKQLCVQALLARLDNAQRLDDALSASFAEAARDIRPEMRSQNLPPQPPRAYVVGNELFRLLGDDAMPLAAELLVKDLGSGWEPWKREGIISVFRTLARTLAPLDGAVMNKSSDSRPMRVLLWAIEEVDDETLAEATIPGLRRFASNELLADLQAVRDRATSESRRKVLAWALECVECDLRMLESQEARFGPAVTTSLPFRVSLDADRALSAAERAEMVRLVGIANDAERSLPRRREAVRLLGMYVAHRECIELLSELVEDATQPEPLRLAAIVAVSQVADRSAVPHLIEWTDDPDLKIRLHARLRLNTMFPKVVAPRMPLRHGPKPDEKAVPALESWWNEKKDTVEIKRDPRLF